MIRHSIITLLAIMVFAGAAGQDPIDKEIVVVKPSATWVTRYHADRPSGVAINGDELLYISGVSKRVERVGLR
jgi:hypothetical protein